MGAKWILKSDPVHYSFVDLERDQKTVWDGVTNNLALKHIRAICRGDLALIYHTGEERSLVGIAEVLSDPYPDPKLKNPKIVIFELKAVERLPRSVSLDEVKKQPSLRNFDLVRLPRLSVMPVTEEQWCELLKLAGKQ